MLRFVLLLALCGLAAVECGPVLDRAVPFNQIGGRIINGTPASLGQFPWQVALYSSTGSGSSFCGGSLITRRFVLTAAHCVDKARTVDVNLGLIQLGAAGRVVIRAAKIVVHQSWNSARIQNDIALLDLGQNVNVNQNIQTINLDNTRLGTGVQLIVSGWGKTADGPGGVSQVLNYVDLTSISNAQCSGTYGNIVTDGIVCATGVNSKSTCNGDSGGPLITVAGGRSTQVGIVSFGSASGCAKGFPSAYTRVASFTAWINQSCNGCLSALNEDSQ